MEKETAWAVFYGERLSFFMISFTDGSAYGPGDEQKYADDAKYVCHGVFDNEADAANLLLDLAEKQ